MYGWIKKVMKKEKEIIKVREQVQLATGNSIQYKVNLKEDQYRYCNK